MNDAPTVPAPPVAPNQAQRAAAIRTAMVEKLHARAEEFRVCDSVMGTPGIIIQQRYAYGKPAGWIVVYERAASNAPMRLVNWDGMIVWEPSADDRTDEYMKQTRFTLEDAVTLCDSLDLWSCRWVQGQGYVNRAGTWIGQNMHESLRVPGWDDE